MRTFKKHYEKEIISCADDVDFMKINQIQCCYNMQLKTYFLTIK